MQILHRSLSLSLSLYIYIYIFKYLSLYLSSCTALACTLKVKSLSRVNDITLLNVGCPPTTPTKRKSCPQKRRVWNIHTLTDHSPRCHMIQPRRSPSTYIYIYVCVCVRVFIRTVLVTCKFVEVICSQNRTRLHVGIKIAADRRKRLISELNTFNYPGCSKCR